MSLPQSVLSPWEEYLELPDTTPAEFIDGEIYMMASPTRKHQEILMQMAFLIEQKIRSKGGDCKVYPAPFGVRLEKDKDNIVEPDISVICDKSKLTDEGCTGAPDWIIEIVSPSDPEHDYIDKLKLYLDAGVREYWIVDPIEEKILKYMLEDKNFRMELYSFQDRLAAGIYDDFVIDFAEIARALD